LRSKIRFGVIGCSSVAKRTIIPAIINTKNAHLQRIGSRDVTKAEKFARQFSCKQFGTYDDVLNDENIDAVYISLPIRLQEDIAIRAAKAGKHIICEKSACTSFVAARRMLNACAKNKVRILEGFSFRFHPQHEYFTKIIHSKSFGKPLLFTSKFLIPMTEDFNDFRFKKELGGGSLNDLGCYIICASRNMFTSEPISVRCSLYQRKKSHVDLHGNLLLEFTDNRYAFGVFGYEHDYEANYDMISNKNTIRSEISYNIRSERKPIITYNGQKTKTVTLPATNQSILMIKNFCDVLKHTKPSLFPYEKDLSHQAQIMEACRMSNVRNKTINIKVI